MNETKNFCEMKADITGIIVSELTLNTAANGAVYCFFRLKIDCDKTPDYITVKSWGTCAEGIARFFKKGEAIEIIGNYKPFYRESKITVLSESGCAIVADLTEEKNGNLTLRLTNGLTDNKLPVIKHCDRYVLCNQFAKISQ